jgi:hypothetical protein
MEDATPAADAPDGATACGERSPATPAAAPKKQTCLGRFFATISAAEHSARKEDTLKAARSAGPVVKQPVILSPSAALSKAYRARVSQHKAVVSKLRTELAHAKQAAVTESEHIVVTVPDASTALPTDGLELLLSAVDQDSTTVQAATQNKDPSESVPAPARHMQKQRRLAKTGEPRIQKTIQMKATRGQMSEKKQKWTADQQAAIVQAVHR